MKTFTIQFLQYMKLFFQKDILVKKVKKVLLTLHININDIGYTVVDKEFHKKKYCRQNPQRVAKNGARVGNESDDLKNEGLKIVITSNTFDKWAKLKVLQGSKLSGHTHTLTEASNLIDKIYQKSETET